jgi:hypothetical protein
MADFEDLQAAIERLRVATGTLTDPHDLAVAEQYLAELERKAAKAPSKGERDLVLGSPAVR